MKHIFDSANFSEDFDNYEAVQTTLRFKEKEETKEKEEKFEFPRTEDVVFEY